MAKIVSRHCTLIEIQQLTAVPCPPTISIEKWSKWDATVSETDLKNLEAKVDALIDACQKLKNENSSLALEKNGISKQHEELMEKTKTARTRLESMIDRLKALDRSD